MKRENVKQVILLRDPRPIYSLHVSRLHVFNFCLLSHPYSTSHYKPPSTPRVPSHPDPSAAPPPPPPPISPPPPYPLCTSPDAAANSSLKSKSPSHSARATYTT